MKVVKGLQILYDFLTHLKVGDEKLQFLRFSKPESKLFALTLKAPIASKIVCFSSAEMFKKPLWQTVWNQIRLLL